MPYHKYAAEFIGTFMLAFVVWVSVAYQIPFPVTPIAAGMTLGLFVYTVGAISGAHLNPAITVGVLSAGKIKTVDAVLYVVCQLAGGVLAMTIGGLLAGSSASVPYATTFVSGIAEALGTFMLAFGVMSATLQKLAPAANGIVVGGSLLIGAYIAAQFSNGILNPAVALSINAFGPMEILGPVAGAICGCWARLALEKKA